MRRRITYFVVTQCPYDRLVQQKLNVLCVVEDSDVGRATLCTASMFRFPWIDAFDDAQSPKVVQRQLQLTQSLATCDIGGSFSGGILKSPEKCNKSYFSCIEACFVQHNLTFPHGIHSMRNHVKFTNCLGIFEFLLPFLVVSFSGRLIWTKNQQTMMNF